MTDEKPSDAAMRAAKEIFILTTDCANPCKLTSSSACRLWTLEKCNARVENIAAIIDKAMDPERALSMHNANILTDIVRMAPMTEVSEAESKAADEICRKYLMELNTDVESGRLVAGYDVRVCKDIAAIIKQHMRIYVSALMSACNYIAGNKCPPRIIHDDKIENRGGKMCPKDAEFCWQCWMGYFLKEDSPCPKK